MKINIDETNAKKRADILLANAATQYSRAALGKLFDMGNVLLDGVPAKRGDKPKLGQVITIDLTPIQREPDVIELPVLYEDNNVIVINKPAGVISHSRGRYWQEASVASFIRDKTRHMEGERAGIVHRLDRGTSGVMIAAKTEAVQQFLQKQFNYRTVKKEYIAIVHGIPAEPTAHIITNIERHPKTPQLFRVSDEGKRAETIYVVKKRGSSSSYVQLQPLTGRTHQLRIHMAYIGCPIIGDAFYGTSDDVNEKRLYLHAKSLTITLPSSDEYVTFTAPVPTEFEQRLTI